MLRSISSRDANVQRPLQSNTRVDFMNTTLSFVVTRFPLFPEYLIRTARPCICNWLGPDRIISRVYPIS